MLRQTITETDYDWLFVWHMDDATDMEAEIWQRLQEYYQTQNKEFSEDMPQFVEFSQRESNSMFDQLEQEGWRLSSIGSGGLRRMTVWRKYVP